MLGACPHFSATKGTALGQTDKHPVHVVASDAQDAQGLHALMTPKLSISLEWKNL